VQIGKIFFFILIMTSCSKRADLTIDKFGNYRVSSKKVFISDAEIDKWRVGPLRRQRVSKGIRIGVTLPKLDMADLKKLIRNTEVDSYILRLKRRGTVGSRVIGHLYVPFIIKKGKTDSSFRAKQLTKGYFFVYYSAAALSSRFENLSCPAFNHTFLIKDVKLGPHRGQVVNFNVSRSAQERLSVRVEPFDYKTVFNGGSSLIGEYIVEMAYFNFEKKERKSSWVELPERVNVNREFDTVIKGCSGNSLPPPIQDTGNPVKKFKFGR